MHLVTLTENQVVTIARGAQRVEILVVQGPAQYQFEGVDGTPTLPVNALFRIEPEPNQVLQLRGANQHGTSIFVYRFY